jgi:hypothetical protein
MGQSTPTTTIALDVFLERYAQFRAELHPREQAWFDELVCRARRHSSAINRRPHLDFERPVMLSMLLEGMRELEDVRRSVHGLRRDLEEAGLLSRRPAPADPLAFSRIGQTVLVEA